MIQPRAASRRIGDIFRSGLQSFLVLLLLSIAVLTALAERGPAVHGRLDLGYDSGNYAYIASRLLRGGTPYVAAWTSKPPGVFFIDAAGLWLGRGQLWGIVALEFAFLLGAACAAYSGLKGEFGFGPAVLGSMAWLYGLRRLLDGGNITEEYSLLFSFGSLWLFALILRRPNSHWLHAMLGLALGCGILLRPNNVGVQIAILVAEAFLVFSRWRPLHVPKLLIATVLGLLVPLAGASLFFVARNAFQPFVDRAILYNLSYLLQGAQGPRGLQVNLIKTLSIGLDRIGFVVEAAFIGMVMAYENLRIQIREHRLHPLTIWLCVDFVLEILLSGLSGRNYLHYFICWLPWIAFSCALLFNGMLPRLAQGAARFRISVLLGAIVVLSAVSWRSLALYSPSLAKAAAEPTGQELLVDYITAHTKPGDTVLAYGWGGALNFLSDRDAPTAHILYGDLVASRFTDEISAEFYQDIQTHPPVLILDPQTHGHPPRLSSRDPVLWSLDHNDYPQPYIEKVFRFVQKRYRYTGEVGGAAVYTLKR